MDIFEFIDGLQISNTQTENFIESAYATTLLGSSFNTYYHTLFSHLFALSHAPLFPRYVIENFLVQQLAVRSSFKPQNNMYLFYGESGEEFAASLFGSVPSVIATWGSPSMTDASIQTVHTILEKGATDDIKQFKSVIATFDEVIKNCVDESCGLVVAPAYSLDTAQLNEVTRVLSDQGTALVICSSSAISLLDLCKFTIKKLSSPLIHIFGDSAHIIRKHMVNSHA